MEILNSNTFLQKYLDEPKRLEVLSNFLNLTNLDKILQRHLKQLSESLSVPVVVFSIVDPTGELNKIFAKGKTLIAKSYSFQDSISFHLLKNDQTISNNIPQDSQLSLLPLIKQFNIKSYLGSHLKIGPFSIGIISIMNLEARVWSSQETTGLEMTIDSMKTELELNLKLQQTENKLNETKILL